MALKSDIYKIHAQIADTDRHYYHTHSVMLARHPSETAERMMVRMLAFIHQADSALQFGEGLCNAEQADLWRFDETGAVKSWIEVGTPDAKRLRKISARAQQALVYCYGPRSADQWLAQHEQTFRQLDNLSVIRLPFEATLALAQLARRQMRLQCTIADGHIWISDDSNTVDIAYTEY